MAHIIIYNSWIECCSDLAARISLNGRGGETERKHMWFIKNSASVCRICNEKCQNGECILSCSFNRFCPFHRLYSMFSVQNECEKCQHVNIEHHR